MSRPRWLAGLDRAGDVDQLDDELIGAVVAWCARTARKGWVSVGNVVRQP